jgi:cell division transport system permease protein
MVLIVVATALLLISFVLIYNTVGMAIHARRLVIHTMQYVGARPGFIRRPFVFRSVLSGVIAGVIASALLASLLVWVRNINAGIFEAIGLCGVRIADRLGRDNRRDSNGVGCQ